MAILSPSLQRRRSQPLSSLADTDVKQQPQETTKTRADGSPRQSFVSSGLLIRKVSSIFSGRSKRSKEKKGKPDSKLKHAPIGHIAVGRPGLGGYESTTPSPSTESFESDIRQPSGLGRLRTGSLSSNGDTETAPYERVRALSTPTLLRPTGLGGGTGTLGRRIAGVGRSVPRVPQSILNLIVSFLPRQHVPRVSLVSGAFCEAARATMLAHLDGRFIRPVRFVKLMSLLALRHDLALLVEALTIHVWPPSFYLDGETQISMLAPSTPSFAQSLLNMHRLKTLTLPSFEYTLMRYFSPLMLTKATFLNHTMSVGDQLQLRTWLECQEEIRHLSFPRESVFATSSVNELTTNTRKHSFTDTSLSDAFVPFFNAIHSNHASIFSASSDIAPVFPTIFPTSIPTNPFPFRKNSKSDSPPSGDAKRHTEPNYFSSYPIVYKYLLG
ncbi:hypothetical protein PTI98_013043 [Pleurotus ostreatus]|nr:hypothetical protein PTI98_013043 [Pleurotus ostreatus]